MQHSTKIALFRRLDSFLPFSLDKVFEAFVGVQFNRKTRKGTPIIVYQMGKVGSRSVHDSLKSSLIPNPLYHIHFLSNVGLKDYTLDCKNLGLWPPPAFLMYGQMLAKKMTKTNRPPWKIISMVRDPIRTYLSHIFFVPQKVRPFLLDDKGYLVYKKVEEYIRKTISLYNQEFDFIVKWFDSEFFCATGIDVYMYEFDPHTGYSIISSEFDDILILRLESLNECFKKAIKEFLSTDVAIHLKTKNVNDSSLYTTIYREILDTLVIPEEVLRRIYKSKYAKHFYSFTEREKFIEYWANPALR